jgi:ATP-dependent protease ClpP protease subunit
MRTILLATILALSAACGNRAEANPPSLNPETTMIIDREITGGTLAPLAQKLAKDIANDTLPSNLTLVINSPGGSVGAGFAFITLLKEAKGTGMKLTCIVPQLAASMAFHILMHCDERHVLAESALLWHRARVQLGGGMFGGPALTTNELTSLGQQLAEIDNHILVDLKATLGKDMEEADILWHFERETLHLGQALCNEKAKNFCISHDSIPGLTKIMMNEKVVRTKQQQSLFDMFRKGELIYIDPRTLEGNAP